MCSIDRWVLLQKTKHMHAQRVSQSHKKSKINLCLTRSHASLVFLWCFLSFVNNKTNTKRNPNFLSRLVFYFLQNSKKKKEEERNTHCLIFWLCFQRNKLSSFSTIYRSKQAKPTKKSHLLPILLENGAKEIVFESLFRVFGDFFDSTKIYS